MDNYLWNNGMTSYVKEYFKCQNAEFFNKCSGNEITWQGTIDDTFFRYNTSCSKARTIVASKGIYCIEGEVFIHITWDIFLNASIYIVNNVLYCDRYQLAVVTKRIRWSDSCEEQMLGKNLLAFFQGLQLYLRGKAKRILKSFIWNEQALDDLQRYIVAHMPMALHSGLYPVKPGESTGFSIFKTIGEKDILKKCYTSND